MASFSEVLLSLILFTYSQHQSESIKLKNSEINITLFNVLIIVYDCSILLVVIVDFLLCWIYRLHCTIRMNQSTEGDGAGGHTTHTRFCLSHGLKILCGLVDHAQPIHGRGGLFHKSGLAFIEQLQWRDCHACSIHFWQNLFPKFK